MTKPVSEPTEAMIEAGTLVFFGLIERKEIDPVSIYLAMKALDPDTHRASSDEVEDEMRETAIAAWLAGARAVHDEWAKADEGERFYLSRDELPDFTEAAHDYAAAMSVQSDKGEG